MKSTLAVFAAILALVAACGEDTPAGPIDAGQTIDGGALDGGPILDGGVAVDGGTPTDGGVAEDGGVPEDGGVSVDGGPPEDGGIPEDGGVPVDGGPPDDGGIPDDGGVPVDGGPSEDGGIPGDGGVPVDGGPPEDGGVVEDGGADGGAGGACNSCHGSAINDAPPKDLQGRTETTFASVGAHQAHLVTSSNWHRIVECGDCHQVPQNVSDPGHLGAPPGDLTWSALASGGAATSYENGTCTVYCHGSTLSGGTNSTPSWTDVGTGQANCGKCHGLPPPPPHPPAPGFNCGDCHPGFATGGGPERHIDGVLDVDAPCGTCHGLPPATGSHTLHAGLAAPVYGALGTAADLQSPAGYAFGCGHCHPLTESSHRNGGRAEVELYDPAAPGGSLKARSPATATYTPGPVESTDSFGLKYTKGTCANVYCHSGIETTTSAVPQPTFDGSDGGYQVTYDPPYTVTRTRTYRDVTWGSASPGCGGCHGYPPRGISYAADGGTPPVSACAGESHSCIDDQGYENLHNFNHGWAPIPCRTCHDSTVTEVGTWTRDNFDVTTLDDIAISGFDKHVNGTYDVVFHRTDPVVYRNPMDLGSASYDAQTQTCSDVSCHFNQTSVTFGTPYRWGSTWECNICHRY